MTSVWNNAERPRAFDVWKIVEADTFASHQWQAADDFILVREVCLSCLAVELSTTEPEVRSAAQSMVIQDGFRVIRRICYGCARAGDTLVPDKATSDQT
jgi:hypothetical protein